MNAITSLQTFELKCRLLNEIHVIYIRCQFDTGLCNRTVLWK